MARVTDGLTPPLVWKYFEGISAIPRGSKNETAVANYVMKTAKSLGLQSAQDRAGTVIVRKPATKGREGSPSVCLQGHLDMVCEKTPDTKHDFLKDPLVLRRVDGFLMATGTTLGADNGIAVAANMALMEDTSVSHGPLEFLFTVDEETGLTGAKLLEPGFVKSRILLNLDSEEEGELYVGCSGGRDTQGFWAIKFETTPAAWSAWKITIGGLRGGHSGLEIDKNRGNAIKMLTRLASAAAAEGARVSWMHGGSKRNAIPRDAEAIICAPRAKADRVLGAVKALVPLLAAEVLAVEPSVAIEIKAIASTKGIKLWPKLAQARILRTLTALPHGVIKMSSDIAGLVETSTNVAVLTTDKKGVTIGTSQRSSVASENNDIVDTVAAILTLGGADVRTADGYPGWKPNLQSPILKVARETYKKMFGNEPAIKAVHAGLECGIIGEKYPGIDMVSFGPTMTGVHSPDEKLDVASVPRFYAFLAGILDAVK
jgi:dipeptidase D